MIKARAGKLVFLGLSRVNVERLRDGQPIRFQGAEILFPGTEFVIMYGETPQKMVNDLRSLGFDVPDVPPELNK